MIGGANRWTDFVKKWASDNDTTYGCALSKPECSQAYRAKYGNRKKLSQKKERELMGAEDKDAPAPPEPDYGDDGGDEGPPPPKKKGRPKKYETEAEAKKAKSQKTMEAKKRRDKEKKDAKGEAKEAEMMGAEDKDAPINYLAEIKRLAKQGGPSIRPRVKELSVIFNSGGMNEKEMDAFEALAEQFKKKPMAPPSGPPPISAEVVAQVKESKASKLQKQRDLMKALRDKRKAEGLSSSGKTLLDQSKSGQNPELRQKLEQRMLDQAIAEEGEDIEPIRLEMMEIAEPTVSTKISPNITIAPPRKLKAPKPQKLQAEGVQDFVSRLPEGLEKYTASFLLESDPLKEFDTPTGLYTLWYCLSLLGDGVSWSGNKATATKFPEVGKVKYGVELTKSQKYKVDLPSFTASGFISLNPEPIIDNMGRVQTAVNVLMGKQTDWRADVYYGGGMGSSKSIRCMVRWTGKKGQRGQDELWKQFWTDTIRPVLMDSPRWTRALARVSERKEAVVAERAVAREAQIADIARIGAEEVQTDLTIKQVLGAVKKVLDDNKMTLSGYTKWKDQGIPFIIGQMKRIFDKGPQEAGMKVVNGYPTPQFTPDRRPVWEAFKALIEKKTGSGMVGGKKKGFLDFITKVGTTLGKPFEKKVGINPFTAGFDLGEKVIAPALMKVIPPRGGMFEDDEIIEESGPFERAKPTEQELMGREDRRREELAEREADNLFIDDDELVDDDDFFEGDEIIEESGPYPRARPTEQEMMGREDARTEELINREADRLFGKGRATGGHWTPPMASHLRKEMRNYQNIAHHLGQHLAESGPKDLKDKLGFIHFSKEAKRISKLIKQIRS